MSPGQKGQAKATEYSPLWNALLGADHPACREYARFCRDIDENLTEDEDPDDSANHLSNDEAMGYMIWMYLAQLPAKGRMALAMRLIADQGDSDLWNDSLFHEVVRSDWRE
jgi:hypothetical protein